MIKLNKRGPLHVSLQIVMVLLLVVSLFVMNGCHGSKGLDAFDMPKEFDTTRNYEITFWAKNDTNKRQTDIYKRAIREFESIYPNIKVTLKLYTDYIKIYNDVITNISTNTVPNVCITYPDHIATYLTGNNVMVSLDDLMKDDRYGLGASDVRFDAPKVDEIIPKFLDEGKINGKQYAMPFMRSTEACYINKTYVEAMGYEIPDVLTWDFIWEVSDAATAKDENGNYIVNGQKVMIPFIYKSTDNMMIQMLRQRNAGYSTESGDLLIFNKDTEEILHNVYDHAGKGAFSTFAISSYPGNFFNAGQCIFAIDSTAGATWIGSHSPLSDIHESQKAEFETVVLPIPQYDTDNVKMISQGPSMCIFNKEDPQEVLASWLFMQYLLTNGIQIAYSKTEGYIPVTTKARDSEEYVDYLSRAGEESNISGEFYEVKINAAKLLWDNIDNTFVTHVFNGSALLRNASGQLIENVVKSANRKEPLDDEYIKKLYADVTALCHLDQISTNPSGKVSKTDFGDMPVMSVLLLTVLCVVWVIIIAYVIVTAVKRKNKSI